MERPPCGHCGSDGHSTGAHAVLERAYRELELATLNGLAPDAVHIERTAIEHGERGTHVGPAVVRKWRMSDGSWTVGVFYIPPGRGPLK